MIAWLSQIFGRAPAVIDVASVRDAQGFARLHAAAFHRGWNDDEFEQLLTERNVLAHALRTGRAGSRGILSGFVLSRLAADEAEILSVVVAESQRGRGLSRDLLRTHLGTLAASGTRKVYLEVEETNVPARKLYAGAGFRDVGHREGYYPGTGSSRSRAVVMSRNLT